MLSLLLLLVCSISTNANPTVKPNVPVVKGGVCTVTGTISILKTDKWIGSGFYVTNTTSLQIFPGAINLPAGNPTPGGAAVAFTGTSSMLLKGNYTYTVSVYYNDGTMNTMQNSGTGFTVP